MSLIFNHIEERTTSILKEHDLFKPNFEVRTLVKRLKITLEEKELGNDVSGFLIVSNDHRIITVNKNNIEKRQNFTIAHEIGHFILHSRTQPLFVDKSPRVLFRNSMSSTGEDKMEVEANAFAAALLMPRELIEDQIKKGPNDVIDAISYLSKKFGVSDPAMTFRLSNLGYSI